MKSRRCESSDGARRAPPGRSAKSSRHLGGALEVPLALRGEQAARAVERRVVADARQDVVELLVLRARVAHAVGGEERQAQPARQIDERLRCAAPPRAGGAAGARRGARPGKDRGEPSRAARAPRRGLPAASARATGPSSPPVGTCSPSACAATCSSVTAVSPFGFPSAPAVIETAEVPVAGPVLDEEREARQRTEARDPLVAATLLRERVRERPSDLCPLAAGRGETESPPPPPAPGSPPPSPPCRTAARRRRRCASTSATAGISRRAASSTRSSGSDAPSRNEKAEAARSST